MKLNFNEKYSDHVTSSSLTGWLEVQAALRRLLALHSSLHGATLGCNECKISENFKKES